MECLGSLQLTELLPNTGELVERLILPFFSEAVMDVGLFAELRGILDENFAEAKRVEPSKHKGSPREIVSLRQFSRS